MSGGRTAIRQLDRSVSNSSKRDIHHPLCEALEDVRNVEDIDGKENE